MASISLTRELANKRKQLLALPFSAKNEQEYINLHRKAIPAPTKNLAGWEVGTNNPEANEYDARVYRGSSKWNPLAGTSSWIGTFPAVAEDRQKVLTELTKKRYLRMQEEAAQAARNEYNSLKRKEIQGGPKKPFVDPYKGRKSRPTIKAGGVNTMDDVINYASMLRENKAQREMIDLENTLSPSADKTPNPPNIPLKQEDHRKALSLLYKHAIDLSNKTGRLGREFILDPAYNSIIQDYGGNLDTFLKVNKIDKSSLETPDEDFGTWYSNPTNKKIFEHEKKVYLNHPDIAIDSDTRLLLQGVPKSARNAMAKWRKDPKINEVLNAKSIERKRQIALYGPTNFERAQTRSLKEEWGEAGKNIGFGVVEEPIGKALGTGADIVLSAEYALANLVMGSSNTLFGGISSKLGDKPDNTPESKRFWEQTRGMQERGKKQLGAGTEGSFNLIYGAATFIPTVAAKVLLENPIKHMQRFSDIAAGRDKFRPGDIERYLPGSGFLTSFVRGAGEYALDDPGGVALLALGFLHGGGGVKVGKPVDILTPEGIKGKAAIIRVRQKGAPLVYRVIAKVGDEMVDLPTQVTRKMEDYQGLKGQEWTAEQSGQVMNPDGTPRVNHFESFNDAVRALHSNGLKVIHAPGFLGKIIKNVKEVANRKPFSAPETEVTATPVSTIEQPAQTPAGALVDMITRQTGVRGQGMLPGEQPVEATTVEAPTRTLTRTPAKPTEAPAPVEIAPTPPVQDAIIPAPTKAVETPAPSKTVVATPAKTTAVEVGDTITSPSGKFTYKVTKVEGDAITTKVVLDGKEQVRTLSVKKIDVEGYTVAKAKPRASRKPAEKPAPAEQKPLQEQALEEEAKLEHQLQLAEKNLTTAQENAMSDAAIDHWTNQVKELKKKLGVQETLTPTKPAPVKTAEPTTAQAGGKLNRAELEPAPAKTQRGKVNPNFQPTKTVDGIPIQPFKNRKGRVVYYDEKNNYQPLTDKATSKKRVVVDLTTKQTPTKPAPVTKPTTTKPAPKPPLTNTALKVGQTIYFKEREFKIKAIDKTAKIMVFEENGKQLKPVSFDNVKKYFASGDLSLKVTKNPVAKVPVEVKAPVKEVSAPKVETIWQLSTIKDMNEWVEANKEYPSQEMITQWTKETGWQENTVRATVDHIWDKNKPKKTPSEKPVVEKPVAKEVPIEEQPLPAGEDAEFEAALAEFENLPEAKRTGRQGKIGPKQGGFIDYDPQTLQKAQQLLEETVRRLGRGIAPRLVAEELKRDYVDLPAELVMSKLKEGYSQVEKDIRNRAHASLSQGALKGTVVKTMTSIYKGMNPDRISSLVDDAARRVTFAQEEAPPTSPFVEGKIAPSPAEVIAKSFEIVGTRAKNDTIGMRVKGKNILNTESNEPGWLGNPFVAEDAGGKYTRAEAVEMFKDIFLARIDADPAFREAVLDLRGKRVGYYKPKETDIHLNVVQEWLANQPLEGSVPHSAARPTSLDFEGNKPPVQRAFDVKAERKPAKWSARYKAQAQIRREIWKANQEKTADAKYLDNEPSQPANRAVRLMKLLYEVFHMSDRFTTFKMKEHEAWAARQEGDVLAERQAKADLDFHIAAQQEWAARNVTADQQAQADAWIARYDEFVQERGRAPSNEQWRDLIREDVRPVDAEWPSGRRGAERRVEEAVGPYKDILNSPEVKHSPYPTDVTYMPYAVRELPPPENALPKQTYDKLYRKAKLSPLRWTLEDFSAVQDYVQKIRESILKTASWWELTKDKQWTPEMKTPEGKPITRREYGLRKNMKEDALHTLMNVHDYILSKMPDFMTRDGALREFEKTTGKRSLNNGGAFVRMTWEAFREKALLESKLPVDNPSNFGALTVDTVNQIATKRGFKLTPEQAKTLAEKYSTMEDVAGREKFSNRQWLDSYFKGEQLREESNPGITLMDYKKPQNRPSRTSRIGSNQSGFMDVGLLVDAARRMAEIMKADKVTDLNELINRLAQEGLILSPDEQKWVHTYAKEIHNLKDTDSINLPGPIGAVANQIIKEGAPAAKELGFGVKQFAEAVRHIVSPRSGVASETLTTVMRLKGARDYASTVVTNMVKSGVEFYNKKSKEQLIEFLDNYRTTDVNPYASGTPEAAFWDTMRSLDEHAYIMGKNVKPDLHWLENHMRMFWKVRPKGLEAALSNEIAGSRGSRNLMGTRGYMRRRIYDLVKEGIAEGGVPVTYNPMELIRMNYMDTLASYTGRRLWDEAKATGQVIFIPARRLKTVTIPEGWAKINDSSVTDVWQSTKQGKILRGHYYAEPGLKRLLDNYLSRDLIRSTHVGQWAMGIKNAYTSVELAGLFHAFFETQEAMSSQMALGMRQITKGSFLEGAKNIAGSQFAAKKYADLGGKAIRYLENPEAFLKTAEGKQFVKDFPQIDDLLQDLHVGGGNLSQHTTYAPMRKQAVLDAWKGKRYIESTLRGVGLTPQVLTHQLFGVYIPRLKVGAFLKEYSFELANTTRNVPREVIAREVWDSIENRFGEMNFDNLFWDKSFKAGMQLWLRSATWKLGNARAFSNAIFGQIKEVKDAYKEGRKMELHRDFAWSIGMSVQAAILAQAMQYFFADKLLGQDEDGKFSFKNMMKDVIYPRVDPKDNDVRVTNMTYLRDLASWVRDPISYIKHSQAGIVSKGTESLENRTFYGTEVFDPDAPLLTKFFAGTKHALVPSPFLITSLQRASDTGASQNVKTLSYVGLNPAPAVVNDTALDTVVKDALARTRPAGARTADQALIGQSMKVFEGSITGKKNYSEEQAQNAIDILAASGKLGDAKYLNSIAKQLGMTKRQLLFSKVKDITYQAKALEAAYRAGDVKEFREVLPIFAPRFEAASSNKNPQELVKWQRAWEIMKPIFNDSKWMQQQR